MDTNLKDGVLINITEKDGKQIVSARELHQFLEVRTKFSDWVKDRIEKYDFIENQDFAIVSEKREMMTADGNKATIIKEYAITLDMAKELAMVEGNERGK